MTSEERAKQFLDQAEPTLYAYDLEFLTSQFDEHAAEQREKCWRKSQHFLSQAGAWDCMQGVKEACLNAVEKEDDK